MDTEFSAGIVVYRQTAQGREYILLCHRAGHWDFPKGHIDPGESKQEAAIRELKEETGLTAIIHDNFEDSFSYIYQKEDGFKSYKTVSFFVGKTDSRDVTLSHEHTDFVWLSLDDALAQLTYQNARDLLKKADTFLS